LSVVRRRTEWPSDGKETIMKIHLLLVLALTLLAASACVIEPIGAPGYYGGGHQQYDRGGWRG
jgi:hypothetical protein